MHLLLVLIFNFFLKIAYAETAGILQQSGNPQIIYVKDITRDGTLTRVVSCDSVRYEFKEENYVFINDSEICLKEKSEYQLALFERLASKIKSKNVCIIVNSRPDNYEKISGKMLEVSNVKVKKADIFKIKVTYPYEEIYKGELRDILEQFKENERSFIEFDAVSKMPTCK